MKRVRLSIDYGPRLIGLAKSDIRGKVRSFDTIENTWNLTQIAHKIARVVNQIGAYEIILGVPMDPNQKTLNYRVKNLNGQLCLNFSTVLANVVHSQCKSRVSVRLYDERYSSFEAKHILWTTNRKDQIDALAAVCILERYLRDEGKGSMPAIACLSPIPKNLELLNYNYIRQYVKTQSFTQETLDYDHIETKQKEQSNIRCSFENNEENKQLTSKKQPRGLLKHWVTKITNTHKLSSSSSSSSSFPLQIPHQDIK